MIPFSEDLMPNIEIPEYSPSFEWLTDEEYEDDIRAKHGYKLHGTLILAYGETGL